MVASVIFLFGNGCDPWFDSPPALFFVVQSRACLISNPRRINALSSTFTVHQSLVAHHTTATQQPLQQQGQQPLQQHNNNSNDIATREGEDSGEGAIDGDGNDTIDDDDCKFATAHGSG